jgi:glutathione S-transferase
MEDDRMMTVYGAPPTRALRVCWMLEELSLPYEIRSVNFQTRLEDKEFMAISPAGSVPAIRDGETELIESCAILEYLGAKYGPTPLAPKPSDPNYPSYISYLHFGEASLSAAQRCVRHQVLRAGGPEAELGSAIRGRPVRAPLACAAQTFEPVALCGRR